VVKGRKIDKLFINFYNIDKKLIRKISVIIFKNLYKEESSLVKKKVLIFI
jgi:hypothetical protein